MTKKNIISRIRRFLFPTTDYWRNSWIWLFYLSYVAITLVYLGLLGIIDDFVLTQLKPFSTSGGNIDISNSLIVIGLLLMLLIIEIAILLYILHLFTIFFGRLLGKISTENNNAKSQINTFKTTEDGKQ